MSNSITVCLPEEGQNMEISYAKVAERNELNETRIEEFLAKETENASYTKAEKGGEVKIENLEEGVYRLEITEDSGYEFSPMIVSIPAWDAKEMQMKGEVEVFPKYTKPVLINETRETVAPQTGDDGNGIVFMSFGVISMIIVLIISCHNRFKCGRMSRK